MVLDKAFKASYPSAIFKAGFDWGVTLSNTFFKTGSIQELKDSLRSQAFLANCLGRWAISNEIEYLSAIDTDQEVEKGKKLYYSLYMLWEARKNAEETLQSLLKKMGAELSVHYSVSIRITNALEFFHENIFTEEKVGGLLGISVSCPVDVTVYDESGLELLTVKDGAECQGYEKGIYYCCVYNPLSDDYDKNIYYGEDKDYSVKISGTDLGLADCSVSRVDSDGYISEFYFENLEIANGTVINLDGISQESVNYKVTDSDGSVMSKSMESRKADKVSTLSIALNTDSAQLEVGGKQLLTVSFVPANATDQKVVWNSDNEAVVSVNSDGVITAVKAGTAVVTASQGDLVQTCSVTVKEQNNPSQDGGNDTPSGGSQKPSTVPTQEPDVTAAPEPSSVPTSQPPTVTPEPEQTATPEPDPAPTSEPQPTTAPDSGENNSEQVTVPPADSGNSSSGSGESGNGGTAVNSPKTGEDTLTLWLLALIALVSGLAVLRKVIEIKVEKKE